MAHEQGKHYFLSYARKDQGIARRIKNDLEKQGFEIWWDGDTNPGTPWDIALEEKIKTALAVLYLASTESHDSKGVKHEVIGYAQDNGKKIIPLWIEGDKLWSDIVVFPLYSIQPIDLRGKKYADGIQKLMQELTRIQGVNNGLDSNGTSEVVSASQLIPTSLQGIGSFSPIPARQLPEEDPPQLLDTIVMTAPPLVVLLLIAGVVLLLIAGAEILSQNLLLKVLAPIAGVTGIIIAFILWKRRKRQIEEMWERREKTRFKVVAMGFHGVGKTTLLASMFNYLSLSTRAGFTLRTENDNDRNKLITIYDDLEQKGSFPYKTAMAETAEWSFDGRFGESKIPFHTLFQFTFLDYPGELAEKIFDPKREAYHKELEEQFQCADILWCILDGQEILRCIEGNTSPNFHKNLRNLLLTMRHREEKPAYFLLTKWDLLTPRYTLPDILAWLKLNNPQFKQVLEHHSGTLRFIPVSVGSFQEREDPNGDLIMKRTSSGQLLPCDVEMPLVYSILEFFEDEIAKAYPTQLEQWLQEDENIPKRRPRNEKETGKQRNKKEIPESMYCTLFRLASEFEHRHLESNLTRRKGDY